MSQTITRHSAVPYSVLPPLAVAIALVVGLIGVSFLQVALTLVVLVVVLAVYVESPRAGVILLWSLWLVVPGVRRLLALLGPVPSNDPLSVLPFVATAVIGVLEAQRCRLDGRARKVLVLGGLGLALGVPLGAQEPKALAFAALAYFSALLAFFIGWSEAERGGRSPTLASGLLALGPLIAVYGAVQYFAMPVWDDRWVESVGEEFESLGSPEEGRIRAFSMLNSPATFAAVASLGLLWALGSQRLTAWRVLTVAPFLAALALTFVRGAWISLVAALAVFAVFGRMRGAARVAVVVAAVGLLVPLGGALGATGQAFQDRVKTITDEEDVSSHERFLRIEAIVPAALENPLGHGLGQAGEASDLSLAPASGSEGDLRRHPDSTILSMVLQLGPAGAALVLGAVLWGFLASLRTAVRPGSELLDRVLPALLGFLIVSMLFGDVLYGLTGAVTWYLLGLTLARSSLAAGPASVPAERPRPVAAGRPASGNGRPRYPRPLPGGAAAR